MEAILCVELKIIQIGFVFLICSAALFYSKKIILDKSDIIIIFLLVFLNINLIFIELKGFVFFKMTYVLTLSILISKVILPNVSIEKYYKKINTIYLIVLGLLVIEALIVIFFGNVVLSNLLMCNGEDTGVRGYIPLYTITKEILPFHMTGLNSIMMGGQTASQLSIIIFIWCFYKFKNTEKRKYLVLGLVAIFILILSPSVTSLFLFVISMGILYLIHLINNINKPIKNFFTVYFFISTAFFIAYFLIKILTVKHSSLDFIYEEYVLGSIRGFGDFNFKEILFGLSYERELELFKLGEISYITELIRYGFVGVGGFYGSILYYIIRALSNNNLKLIVPNIFIIFIYILGNIHYPVMFSTGLMELFALHLAYIIYVGFKDKKLDQFS
jgi:hypothetical protein